MDRANPTASIDQPAQPSIFQANFVLCLCLAKNIDAQPYIIDSSVGAHRKESWNEDKSGKQRAGKADQKQLAHARRPGMARERE